MYSQSHPPHPVVDLSKLSGGLLSGERACRTGVLAVSLLLACSATPPIPADLAIVGVEVISAHRDFGRTPQTVLVEGGRIVAVGPSSEIEVAPGARVIDGQVHFLMPGLVDLHIHLRHAEVSALREYLEVGVTTAREMNGRESVLEWRDRIASGELLGPRLVVAAPTLANFSSQREGFPTPETAEQARSTVRAFREAGYDWIKIYTFLPGEVFDAVLEAALAAQMPVGGHVPVATGLSHVLDSGLHSIEHLTEYISSSLTAEGAQRDQEDFRSVFGAGDIDWPVLDRYVAQTVEAGVWNVPTLVWFDRNLPTSLAEEAWSDPELRRQAEKNRREVVRRLHAAGALLAIGTDSDAGDDLPASAIVDELIAFSEAGISNADILELATLRGAELLGLEDEIGVIEPGYTADLLILSCDPVRDLSCLRQPEWVISRGVPAAGTEVSHRPTPG